MEVKGRDVIGGQRRGGKEGEQDCTTGREGLTLIEGATHLKPGVLRQYRASGKHQPEPGVHQLSSKPRDLPNGCTGVQA